MADHARHTARLTSKGQATMPSAVRKHLGVRPGDRVVYETDGDQVVVRKADAGDLPFLRLQDETFSEWLSEADEEAYGSL